MKPGATYVDHFTVVSATGALVDSDATPTATVYKNGAIDSGIAVTVTKISTGSYVASFTAGSGYVSGDKVSAFATCAVSGVAVGVWLKTVEIDSAFVSDVLTDTNAIHAHAQTLLDGVNVTEWNGATAPTNMPSNVVQVNNAAVTLQTDLAKTTDIPTVAAIATAVWGYATKTLTSFGTLVADIRASIWSGVRRLTNASGVEYDGALESSVASVASGMADGTDVTNIRLDIAAVKTAVDAIGTGGGSGYTPGSKAVSIGPFKRPDGSFVSRVEVVAFTDAGALVDDVQAGITDDFGEAVLMLDPGTYYIRPKADGFYTQVVQIVVT